VVRQTRVLSRSQKVNKTKTIKALNSKTNPIIGSKLMMRSIYCKTRTKSESYS